MLKFFLIIAVVCLVISGISIGAWTSGQQQRANFYTESATERHSRTRVGFVTAIIGFISLGLAGLIYLF